jgi:hypothetical protein
MECNNEQCFLRAPSRNVIRRTIRATKLVARVSLELWAEKHRNLHGYKPLPRNDESLSQNIRCPGRDSNWVLPINVTAWGILVSEIPRGKRPFRRPRNKRESNNKVHDKEIILKIWSDQGVGQIPGYLMIAFNLTIPHQQGLTSSDDDLPRGQKAPIKMA